MIELKGTIRIPLAAQKEALTALKSHMIATRKEASNLLFEVATRDDPEVFHVHEQFKDMRGFERHQALGKKRRWGQVSGAFVREYEVREI